MPPIMFQEAWHFKEECDSLAAILDGLSQADFKTKTLFKGWTIDDIIGHLHLWNIAADQTLNQPEAFQKFMMTTQPVFKSNATHQQLQNQYFEGKSGLALYDDWKAYYPDMAERFAHADPEARVKWAGPDMSVRSCIIARQMEHWAHAQAIFDLLKLERVDTDRLKNIAHLGVTTYSWSFKVKGLEPMLPKPYICLSAPGGDIWQWNEPQQTNKIEGRATEFCQIVTQCRNIGDTSLHTTGPAAKKWMEIAQCFAGGPETPPAKGTRKKA